MKYREKNRFAVLGLLAQFDSHQQRLRNDSQGKCEYQKIPVCEVLQNSVLEHIDNPLVHEVRDEVVEIQFEYDDYPRCQPKGLKDAFPQRAPSVEC